VAELLLGIGGKLNGNSAHGPRRVWSVVPRVRSTTAGE
jgi:hypothetical protein